MGWFSKSFLLCSGLILLNAAQVQAYEIHYQISVNPAIDRFKVKVCFHDHVPKALYNGAWNDNRWLQSAVDADQQDLKVSDNRMVLNGVKPKQCIRYQARLLDENSRRSRYLRAGSDKVVNNVQWLWQPKNLSGKDRVTLSFILPQGYQISTPWQPLADSPGTTRFNLGSTPYQWDSRIAIGRFTLTPLKIAGQTLQVAILNSDKTRKAAYIEWISQAAAAIAGLHGNFPVDNAQILIVPIGAQREAVPWGEVQRGGSAAAHFFVDSFRPIQAFKDDWTATHELSHLLVPFIASNELWLSEGIASYYQNLARAKAGMISKEKGWRKLLAGFGRGSRAAKADMLSNSSVVMQMYWGGAAMILMADARLRELPGDPQSVAMVLRQFNQCCRPSSIRWSGLALMTKFDQLSGSKIFTGLYHQEAEQRKFPNVHPLLTQLGFIGLQLDQTVPLSSRAQAIME
jgi:predicted metalloprotease with PDZ domain